MEISLANGKVNEKYQVVSVTGTDKMAERLRELGFVFGTNLNVCHRSMLSHCAVIEIRGGKIALRNNALTKIMVKRI